MKYVTIQQFIDAARQSIPLNKNPASSGFDVPAILSELLHADQWDANQHQWLLKLANKINTTPKVFTHYTLAWRNSVTAALDDRWLSVTALLLYQEFLYLQEKNIAVGELLKHLNTLLKLLDSINVDSMQIKAVLRKSIKTKLNTLVSAMPPVMDMIPEPPVQSEQSIPVPPSHTPQILPITVLFSEGPIARAYLATLYSLGYAPQKIIHLIASHDVTSRKPVARWLPARWRARYAAALQYSRMHYWPKKIAKDIPKLKKVLVDTIINNYHFPASTIDQANKPLPLTSYCDNIVPLMVTGLRDPVLYEYLQQAQESLLLFTGGGIVSKELLEIPGLRFLHIHPGFLPEIRGADGLLWSGLLMGTPSVSAFYLAPGIDVGDIILALRLFSAPIPDLSHYDCKTLYRALYSFFDPWIRAYALRQLLISFPDISVLPAIPQQKEQGTTYHFMHPLLQKLALLRLFGGLSNG